LGKRNKITHCQLALLANLLYVLIMSTGPQLGRLLETAAQALDACPNAPVDRIWMHDYGTFPQLEIQVPEGPRDAEAQTAVRGLLRHLNPDVQAKTQNDTFYRKGSFWGGWQQEDPYFGGLVVVDNDSRILVRTIPETESGRRPLTDQERNRVHQVGSFVGSLPGLRLVRCTLSMRFGLNSGVPPEAYFEVSIDSGKKGFAEIRRAVAGNSRIVEEDKSDRTEHTAVRKLGVSIAGDHRVNLSVAYSRERPPVFSNRW
jgi:hypothetical protein